MGLGGFVMVEFDTVANDVGQGEEDEVDAEAGFEYSCTVSVAFFPWVGFLSPFFEVVHRVGCGARVEQLRRLCLVSCVASCNRPKRKYHFDCIH